jgi:asparagine synthase (glutamine-hydrolysing)
MCGIAGILKLSLDGLASADVLDRMLESIIHRGPDEDGKLVDGPLAMGMRRLSIIDLTDGQQPIFDESNRYGVVFNGEIYNYRELREQLLSRGHQLKTRSDTEVIVHLYEELGQDCVSQLRGMFCFAIWDRQRQEVFIARDRLGIKPLYYSKINGDFVFGSEIKSILQHPGASASLDLPSLSQYLSLKYVPSPRTLFAGIQSLPPGHSILVSRGNIRIEKYWDLSFSKPEVFLSEIEYSERLLELLRESISLHLRSDVPFGAFLSGGLDSSTIVALMAEQISAPVKTFSVGFGGPGLSDELPYAQQVATHFGCEHHILRITSGDFIALAEDVLWHLDQPIADQATVATYMVAKLARQHVKMVLTGEGGDELFAGYARYAGERHSRLFTYLPDSAGALLRATTRALPGLRRARIAVGALTYQDEATRFANWFPMFGDDAKRQLLSSAEADIQKGAAWLFQEQLKNCDAKSSLDRMLYVDTKLWLADYLLLRGDKLTMANSLEARVPFLDHKVVEFAAQLPPNLKLRGTTGKYLLKQVARKLLPPQIIDRPKQGFPIPIDRWLRNEAKSMMQDLLSADALARRNILNPTMVQRLIQEHISGFANHATQLWGLMSVEMWMRKFIDHSCVAAPCDSRASTTESHRVKDA